MVTSQSSIDRDITRSQGTREDVCPTCGQHVTHLKFAEIHRKLAADDRERLAELRRQVAVEVTAAKKSAQAQAHAEVAAAKKSAADQLETMRAATRREVELSLAPKVAAGEAASKQLSSLRADHAKELAAQRTALEKDIEKRQRADRAAEFRKTAQLQAKVASLQRQLDHKTADERGEGAEVDVFETLKAAFKHDNIRRVKKGQSGADIVHEVVEGSRVCGTLVYDSKDRDAWQNGYVTKLKADQLAAKADHAILASRAFPAGATQVTIREGVIVINPARVLAIAQIVRDAVVRADRLRLSREERDEKAARLYTFMTSERCSQLFERIEDQTDAILEIEAKEQKAHNKVWNDRGQMLASIAQARALLEVEIERVIEMETIERSA